MQSVVVDAQSQKIATLTGALGQANYMQVYSGTSSSGYTLYATTTSTCNAAGNRLSTISPDGSTTNSAYNDLGQTTSTTDPDRGTITYTYDPNGNPIEEVDARGSTGTIYAGYDGLNRPLWRNNTNSASGAWVTYSYDSTANSNNGIGSLTSETFTGSGGLTGSYAYMYDVRAADGQNHHGQRNQLSPSGGL